MTRYNLTDKLNFLEALSLKGGEYMASGVGDTVHPWYKGVHEWTVTKVATLHEPIEWAEKDEHGHVGYDPKIMKLGSSAGEVFWFNYWMSTDKTQGKMAYGGGPPMLEEPVLLELIREAIGQNMFSSNFLKELKEEIQAKIG